MKLNYSKYKYAAHVATLKKNPDRWAKVAEFKVNQTAYGTANHYKGYFPGLETACRKLPNGNTGVWFRWPSNVEVVDGP